MPELDSYERFIVFFSGGKDSAACLFQLLEGGVDPSRIELWHHDVDGHGTHGLMDWPCTPAYCRKVAQAWHLPIYFSWREGGFEREMLRQGTATGTTWFETPEGLMKRGGNGPAGTRMKFPQVCANLSMRWCSSALKIDVADIALRNQPRFNHSRTLVLSGERAEESAARSSYAPFETHRADASSGKLKRHVDVWRAVHAWSEQDVWACLQRNGFVPHVAYQLGWSRLSCMACIFGGSDQWASVRALDPNRFSKLTAYEDQFGITIDRKLNLGAKADRGVPYPGITQSPELTSQALRQDYPLPVRCDPAIWTMPVGAYGHSAGPS